MSGITLSFLAAGGGPSYWIATLGDRATVSEVGAGIAIDSAGNSYVTGYSATTFNNILVAKYDASGVIQWQRTLSSANAEQGTGIALDSSANVYVCGRCLGPGADEGIFIAKYNTSGTLQWQRVLGDAAAAAIGFGIAVDSSGNAYITGATTNSSAGSYDISVSKYNTSGTLQWQRGLGGTGVDFGYGAAVDSSGNAYIAGYSNISGSAQLIIAKYDTSGTIQWQRQLGSAGVDVGNAVAVDSSGNVYATGYTDSTGAGVYDAVITKYDTSGTIQWQRVLGSANYEQGTGIAVDSSGNVYVTGYTTISATEAILIAKYNSSGTIQWQRTLNGSGNEQGSSIKVDNLDNYYITGRTATGTSGNEVILAKLPTDGSLTGTYGGFTYAVSTLTAATSALTASTSTLTTATTTLSSAGGTLTDAASAFTSVKITV
jgi:uncharacterized delta-60 repeat protein